LKIEKSVTDEEVKKPIETMAKKKYHPDRVKYKEKKRSHKERAEEKFKEVQKGLWKLFNKRRGL